MTRNILLAIDHGEHSEKAYKWALSNVLKKDDNLFLLHVYPVEPMNIYDFGSYGDKVTEAKREAGIQLLEQKTRECVEAGFNCKGKLSSGDAREVIVNGVKKWDVDFVVLGSRGMGALKRTVLGSVSDYCVHNCDCPITIVRNPTELESQSAINHHPHSVTDTTERFKT